MKKILLIVMALVFCIMAWGAEKAFYVVSTSKGTFLIPVGMTYPILRTDLKEKYGDDTLLLPFKKDSLGIVSVGVGSVCIKRDVSYFIWKWQKLVTETWLVYDHGSVRERISPSLVLPIFDFSRITWWILLCWGICFISPFIFLWVHYSFKKMKLFPFIFLTTLVIIATQLSGIFFPIGCIAFIGLGIVLSSKLIEDKLKKRTSDEKKENV